VLQQIADLMRNARFADKFVFVEDYDINVDVTWCRAWMCG